MTVQKSSAAGHAPVAEASVRAVGGPGDRPVRAEVLLTWEGDLDVASAPVLAAALHVLAQAGVRTVVVDASAVVFMDCIGLGTLLEADARLDGGIRLVRPSLAVLRLLGLVGLADRFAGSGEPGPVTGTPDLRATIEQSRGLLVGSFGCTVDQAAKMLVSTALRQNVRVHVLAALLVAVTSAELGPDHGGPARAVQRVMLCGGATP